MRLLRARLEFQPRDLWVGLYWTRMRYFHVYICLVPMLPLHLTFGTGQEGD